MVLVGIICKTGNWKMIILFRDISNNNKNIYLVILINKLSWLENDCSRILLLQYCFGLNVDNGGGYCGIYWLNISVGNNPVLIWYKAKISIEKLKN